VTYASPRLTITALAARLGVSKATVSKALSPHPDRSDLAEDTKSRIQAAAARLGWTPDARRAARARRHLGNIGLVSQRSAPQAGGVYADLLDGLATALESTGRRLLFVPALRTADWNRLLTDQRIDGAVLMEPLGDELASRIVRERFPAVVLNLASPLALPQICCDEAANLALAVTHLAEAGHRIIAFLHSPGRQPHYSLDERRAAFTAACAIAGIEGIDVALEALPFYRAWCAQPIASRPTAVIAYNHGDACELARITRADIPQRLSLVSCDDTETLAWLDPAITALTVPMTAMATVAIERLIEEIEGRSMRSHTVIRVAGSLICRGSVAAPAQ